jgi:hypothetical protein
VIHVVDRALEEFLRIRVPLSSHAVDISFQAPDKTWGAGLTRPTVNVFLWDVSRHAGYLKTGMEVRRTEAGATERRRTNPVVDLGYLVTTWATERRDEHELLGSILECLLAHPAVPKEFLPERFANARCGLSLGPPERRMPGEFWSALEGRLRPGLQVQVALPVAVFEWQGTAKPAEQLDLAARPVPRGGARKTRLTAGAERDTGEGTGDAGLTRRRRNGALVMEGRSPRRPRTTESP